MRKSVFPTRKLSASPSPRDFKCKAMSVSYLDGMARSLTFSLAKFTVALRAWDGKVIPLSLSEIPGADA